MSETPSQPTEQLIGRGARAASNATDTSGEPRRRGRRFQDRFCRFHAVGVVVQEPSYSKTRRGQAVAAMTVQTNGTRIVELLLFDRDLATLKGRLGGATIGANVFAEGSVQAPRRDRQELPQFLADVVVVVGHDGVRRPEGAPAGEGDARS
jgi:hypothetical protein